MSKLALLVSNSMKEDVSVNGGLSELNRELDVIEYQENVPEDVLEVLYFT